MALIIEGTKTIPINNYDKPIYLAQTIKGLLENFYLKDSLINVLMSEEESAGDYTEVNWIANNPNLTSRPVEDLVIKSFPGIGPMSAFKFKYSGKSVIMLDMSDEALKFNSPTFVMTKNSTWNFTITDPEDITYDLYKIYMMTEYFGFEYVTYDKTCSCPIPDVKGTYTIWVVGYQAEGQVSSVESLSITEIVTTGKDSFAPTSSAAELQAQIDELRALITTP